MNLNYLYNIVAAVAPVDGIGIGDPTDKATWRIDFKTSATPAQRANAQAVIDGYDPANPPAAEADYQKQLTIDALDVVQLQIAFNHENRIRALEGKQPINATQFKTAVKALF